MATLNIVMMQPQIPQNTGNVARTCAVTGARLHLVGPMGFEVDDKKLKRAGLDYWHLLDITHYKDAQHFFEQNKGGSFFYFTSKGPRAHTEVEYPDGCFIVFGSETHGLPEELLHDNPDCCVRIPMRGGARCLNLSSSIAVGTYEVLRQWNFPELKNQGSLTMYEW